MAYVPKKIIGELQKLQIKFLWKSGAVKIRHSKLSGDGGIKNVDIEAKMKALKLTWIRRLCDDNHRLGNSFLRSI